MNGDGGAGVERLLEPARRGADLVEPRRRGELRRRPDRPLQRARRPPRPPRSRPGSRSAAAATSCASSSSRSPPTADSSAISHSAAIETASRTSRRSATGCAAVVDARARCGRRPRPRTRTGSARTPVVGLGGQHAPSPALRPGASAAAAAAMRSRSSVSATRARIGQCTTCPSGEPCASPLRAPRRRPTTASARCSRSARIRAGGGSWSRACRATAATCSTSRPARASSPSGCSPRGHARHRARPEPGDARVGAAPVRRTGRARRGLGRPRSRSRTPSFDHLTFTYLLRYVDDPGATLRELARVVRPGGTVASLEFCVPRGVWRPLWDLYVGVGLPRRRAADLAGLARGRPLPRPARSAASTRHGRSSASSSCGARPGIADVRARRLSLGGGVVIWGIRRVRPAFYALRRAAGATT